MSVATMRAQVFHEPEKMRLESRPVPTFGPEEVLVRVHATGICGSDISFYYGKSSVGTPTGKGPIVLGHEISGVVAEVGAAAAEKGGFRRGDRVVVNPIQSDPASPWTARGLSNVDIRRIIGVTTDGGLADYCTSHWYWTVPLPAAIHIDHAASMEPLACAVYAVKKAAIEAGSFVVVLGPGPAGLMMVQLAKAAGAGTGLLVGTRDYRLALGLTLGADLVANVADPSSPHHVADLAELVKSHNGGELADRAITSTSAVAAVDLAVAVTGRAATLVLFGMPGDKDEYRIPAASSMFMDKTIRFSWLAPTTWPEALSAMATGKVKMEPLQTRRFPLEELPEAIRQLRDRVDDPIKTLIQIAPV